MNSLIEYIPILTSTFSLFFFVKIYNHWRERKTKYLLWWTIGVLTFGLGTLTESINAVFGWSEINMKVWYIVGALLGGFPLAQGSVYLLMSSRFAKITTYIFVSLIIIGSIFVLLSPINYEMTTGKLTGEVLSWEWVRKFSPLINIYALIFLVGGAIISAKRYYKMEKREVRFLGNVFIAIGGLLPGIGGTFTRYGYVNVLFITEFIGLVSIYYGYHIIKVDNRKQKVPLQTAEA